MKKLNSIMMCAASALLIVSCATSPATTASNDPNQPTAPTFIEGDDPAPEGKWELLDYLSDEFNVDGLDTFKWCADPKTPGQGWMGRPPGLFQEKNVTVKDGSLQIACGVLDEPIVLENYGRTHEFKYFGGIVRATAPVKVGWYYECRMKMNKSEMGGGYWLMVRDGVDGLVHEIDVVECVGHTSELTEDWGKDWNHIMHSNAIHRVTKANPVENRDEDFVLLDTKNHEDYHVYGAWWKSPKEIVCFLDGKHVYTLVPPVGFDLASFMQLSIEYYDWNPIPDEGNVISTLSGDDLVSHFDWVRVWELK